MMDNYSSVFIGIIDILGYKAVEQHLSRNGGEHASILLGRVFSTLNSIITSPAFNNPQIKFIQYGDGFVVYSTTRDAESLSIIVKNINLLLANSLTQGIPLRAAITEGDIRVSQPNNNGMTITGSGWLQLQELEKTMDWMGGLLHLPSYDNFHQPEVTKLIRSGNLIVEQKILSDAVFNFEPPYKEEQSLSNNHSWFLNWQKPFKLRNEQSKQYVENWWRSLGYQSSNPDVINKQQNSIKFAEYCYLIQKCSELVYFSKVCTEIDIGGIQG